MSKNLIITIALMLTLVSTNTSFGQMKQETKRESFIAKEAMLKSGMRYLWDDHVLWTRNVILCLVDSLPGSNQAIKRLLQNQVDIGNAFKPYYGEEAGNKLTKILYEHINLSAEVVKDAKSNNTLALVEANKKWYANADALSVFFNNANPNWTLVDMKMMMYYHLKLTTDEATLRIKKDYDGDIIAYDKIHIEIQKMADVFADGIIMQFPGKFKAHSKK